MNFYSVLLGQQYHGAKVKLIVGYFLEGFKLIDFCSQSALLVLHVKIVYFILMSPKKIA